jgi:hypothetical protein
MLTANSAFSGGGGYSVGFESSLIYGNYASASAGGAQYSGFNNCTVVKNESGGTDGGAHDCSSVNSIIMYNSAPIGPNCERDYGQWIYTCSDPLTSGASCISNDPVFADFANNDFRLASNSPCINRGTNEDWMAGTLDLDGNPRIRNARVDMGAYESPYWGMASDVDGDRVSDYDEACVAGTDPMNAASCFDITPSATQFNPSGVVITWASRAGRLYNVSRGTNLAGGAFDPIFADVPGQDGVTSVTDTTAAASAFGVYRITVRLP